MGKRECVRFALVAGVSVRCHVETGGGERCVCPAGDVGSSEPARIAIEKLTAGNRKLRRRKWTARSCTLRRSTAVMGVTTRRALTSPASVRAAAEKYFGSAAGLKASREVEKAKTFYEVEGKKKGTRGCPEADGCGPDCRRGEVMSGRGGLCLAEPTSSSAPRRTARLRGEVHSCFC